MSESIQIPLSGYVFTTRLINRYRQCLADESWRGYQYQEVIDAQKDTLTACLADYLNCDWKQARRLITDTIDAGVDVLT